MCIAREMINLCKCGCTEIEHEEVPIWCREPILEKLATEGMGRPHPGRGKCSGKKLIFNRDKHYPDSCSFEPCSCPKFEPFFKADYECGGIV